MITFSAFGCIFGVRTDFVYLTIQFWSNMKKLLGKEIITIANQIIESQDNWDLKTLQQQVNLLSEKVTILNFVEQFYRHNGSSENRIQYSLGKTSEFVDEVIHKDKHTPDYLEEPFTEMEAFVSEETFEQQPIQQPTIQEPQKEVELVQKNPDVTTVFSDVVEHPGFEPKQEVIEPKQKSLNDHLGKSNAIDLNNRLAFIKYLFLGSESEYNKVLKAIEEKQSIAEVAIYLEQEVKPIYNYWKGKEEYEERFLTLVMKRFDV